ncbi:uncharacterized protein BT62DRAFT_209676 [Guyanagaster necrorhizus]|uniref:RING-type domain-containing protein n=1 Tax=Guyanagaster necrorhizus TaxID=856835 RepID=A0A9P7VRF5_9AGAR|nr:uncharacterized protein BT62DRAFT_209676 [Guyanagaster necrorhizus MCA 3950]KAG7445095.1 hypothetical protein BT62DRAFT_209676 [Guyanagaster necrorhizus MCA 3950]
MLTAVVSFSFPLIVCTMDIDEDCCVICLAGFTDPVCTPCPAQHMFCMQCLNGWISEAAEAGRTAYSCPSCRRAFDRKVLQIFEVTSGD